MALGDIDMSELSPEAAAELAKVLESDDPVGAATALVFEKAASTAERTESQDRD